MVSQKLAEDRLNETYRSMVSHGSAAIKAVMLANGGAAVALLAFLGNVWGSDCISSAPNMFWPMLAFVIGLVSGTLSAATAYLTQLALYRQDQIALGLIQPISRWLDEHVRWLWVSIGSVAISLSLFAAGGIGAATLL